jgi:hypothetical protein
MKKMKSINATDAALNVNGMALDALTHLGGR